MFSYPLRAINPPTIISAPITPILNQKGKGRFQRPIIVAITTIPNPPRISNPEFPFIFSPLFWSLTIIIENRLFKPLLQKMAFLRDFLNFCYAHLKHEMG